MKKALIFTSALLNVILLGIVYLNFKKSQPTTSPSIHAQQASEELREMMIEAERLIAQDAYGENNVDEYMELFQGAFNGNGPYAMLVANEGMKWKSTAIQRGRILAHPVDSLEMFLGTSNQSEQDNPITRP
jgi:hypothetical protein